MFIRPLLATVALVGCLAAPARAQRLYRAEANVSGVYNLFDKSATDLKGSIGVVGRAGYWITRHLGLEGEVAVTHTRTVSADSGISVRSFAGSALWNFALGLKHSAFLRAGYSSVAYTRSVSCKVQPVGGGPCGSAGAFVAGAGFRIALKPTVLWRSDLSINRSNTSLKFSNVALSTGVSVMLGSEPLVDSDRDRVYDRYDQCPGTPLGALVNQHGCPTDADRDGVFDGLDRCPNTPVGATVDPVGCTSDGDGDGVLNGLDQCPDTPKGATVDPIGCPRDSDADGVLDGLDRCADTPEGATVDPLGCPSDSDNDGVPDGIDKCPITPPGTRVNLFGCAVNLDSDRDGVPEAADRCPNTPPNTKVDSGGCPIALAPPIPPRGSGSGILTPPDPRVGFRPEAVPAPFLALRSANRLAERTGTPDPTQPNATSGAAP